MKISVILSTYNRFKTLAITLQSLCQQETDGSFDYEIIVVDNNSQDQTKETIESFAKENSKIYYVFEPKQGISNARNAGINNATGEILSFTDDDVIVDSNWLTIFVKFFEEFQCDGIGGRVLPIYPNNTPQWVKDHPNQIAGAVVIYDQGEKIRQADFTMERFIGCNLAF